MAKGFNSEDKGIAGLTKAAQIINRGKQELTPPEGYLESVKTFFEQLEKQSDLENKGIHCKKGSTVCYVMNLEASIDILYDIFKKEIPNIKPKEDFFTIRSTEGGYWIETEHDIVPNKVEDLYKLGIVILKSSGTDEDKLKRVRYDINKYRIRKELLISLKSLNLNVLENQNLFLASYEYVLKRYSLNADEKIIELLEDTSNPNYYQNLIDFLYGRLSDTILTDLIREIKFESSNEVDEKEPITKSSTFPTSLNFKKAIIILDTGFVIDLLKKYKNKAPSIIAKMSEQNRLIILDQTWAEIVSHHNSYIGRNREISSEMMYVLNKIYTRKLQQFIKNGATAEKVLLAYYEVFYDDHRKYYKDPISENDEEIVNLALSFGNKNVVVLSNDAHVNKIIKYLIKKSKLESLKVLFAA